MPRQTSMQAYAQIENEGLLSQRRLEVYQALFKCGPATSAEVFKHLSDFNRRGIISQSRARFTELRELGVIDELGTRKCGVTGREAIVWGVNGKLPTERQKPPTKKEKKQEILKMLDDLHWLSLDHNVHKIKEKVMNL